MNSKQLLIFSILIVISGCTPGIMKCFLKFENYHNNYTFNYSKEELKRKIVESYSYNENLLVKNLGKTLIENEEVNEKYRTSTTNWLDKKNWDNYKEQILNEMTDTLTIIIGKHHSRKTIKFKAIIDGNKDKSELRIKDVEFQRRKECEKAIKFYQDKIQDIIENKFIKKLK